jgi:hypothetical protein
VKEKDAVSRPARLFVSCALVACALRAALQANPLEPPARPVMEPGKLGPRPEVVDPTSYARVLHVAAGGSDSAGGSQDAPLATISQALSRAVDAGEAKRHAILVAGGEYKGETIRMKPYVDLFGGFDRQGWRRDIEAHRTVLDGEGQRRVVVGANNARIDGFVIRNGKVRGPGAGVLCDRTSPVISNNTIIENATLEPGDIDKEMIHQHGNDGAAIACINGSAAAVVNNVISRNTTQIGGGAGIAVSNFSTPLVLNNVITGNESGLTDVGLSRSSNGAAISATNAQHRPPRRMAVINNVISNNRARGKSDAGGIYLEYDSSPLVAANWLVGNWCEDDGSAVYIMKGSHPVFSGNIVAGNNSSAIRLSKEGRGDLHHNLVFANTVGVACISSWMDFHNNTVVDNQSGLSYGNPYAPHLKPSLISANLIYGNEGGQIGVEKGQDAPVVTGNDIEGGYAGGDGNFDQQPQFVDDGLRTGVASLDYDKLRAVTTITAGGLAGADKRLVGRLVRVGEKWGIIGQAGGTTIACWGDLRPIHEKATELTIAPTYRLRDTLVPGVGSQTKP